MKIYNIPVCPVPKPRMTQRDKWQRRPGVVRYYAFKDALREWVENNKSLFVSLSYTYQLVFYIPVPKSWSNKKKSAMHLKPHRQTPDKDNLEKAFLDALMTNDAHVYSSLVEKYWWNGEGHICVYVPSSPYEHLRWGNDPKGELDEN